MSVNPEESASRSAIESKCYLSGGFCRKQHFDKLPDRTATTRLLQNQSNRFLDDGLRTGGSDRNAGKSKGPKVIHIVVDRPCAQSAFRS